MATTITVSAQVAVSPEKAWELWNTPQHITQWNSPSPEWHSPTAENELKEGGKFSFRMEAKDGSMGFDFAGAYDRIIPNEHLEYTMGDGRKCIVKFTPKDSGTFIEETFDPENINPEEMQRAGWQAILDNFKQYAESRELKV